MTPAGPLVLACITTATFTDLVAYSVAVPVLPDYATRFNASPTMIGLLFASFGVTLLVAVDSDGSDLRSHRPQGADDRRPGAARRVDAGVCVRRIAADAVSSRGSLQGAADGMTWIVGFAMIADLYGPEERGRAMGLAMAGSTLGIIIGPVWEAGCTRSAASACRFSSSRRWLSSISLSFALVAPATQRLAERRCRCGAS